ncbi:MAG: glycerol-3-phosphate 1-O-acyltransferase PlsY [Pseudomonadota bacterium]
MSWLVVLLAFALGGVLGGSLIGSLRGVNLRAAGSGNIGATNALRTQGTAFALAVLTIDAGKGALAVLLLPRLMVLMGQGITPTLPYLCGAAAVLGHCFSPWHRFNGGKGVATLAGVFLALLPAAFGWMLSGFVLTVLLTGVVSLATLFGGLVALLYVTCWSTVGLFSAAGAFVLLMVLLVLVTHRDNWRRLLAGCESRFEKARLLGRALRLPTIGSDNRSTP